MTELRLIPACRTLSSFPPLPEGVVDLRLPNDASLCQARASHVINILSLSTNIRVRIQVRGIHCVFHILATHALQLLCFSSSLPLSQFPSSSLPVPFPVPSPVPFLDSLCFSRVFVAGPFFFKKERLVTFFNKHKTTQNPANSGRELERELGRELEGNWERGRELEKRRRRRPALHLLQAEPSQGSSALWVMLRPLGPL